MNDLPSHLVVELEDSDVHENLAQIVDEMSKIRHETITDRKISDAQKDEYLHLTYRLASCIEALADESAIKEMQKIAKALNRHDALVCYDPAQDTHLKRKGKRFAQNLEAILIKFIRYDLKSVDDKHHFLQAIKYLGVANEPPEEKERVYNTILPFHGGLTSDLNTNFVRGLVGLVLGECYDFEQIDELTIRINSWVSNTDILATFLEKRGFCGLRIGIPTEIYADQLSQLKGIKLIGPYKPSTSGNPLVRKLLANIVKYTSPLSATLLGMLPIDIREEFKEYIKPEFPAVDSGQFKALEAILSCGVPLVGGGVLSYLGAMNGLFNPGFFGGLYLFVESFVRIILRLDTDHLLGSLPFKVGLYALETHLKQRNKDLGSMVEVEIELRSRESAEEPYVNPLPYFKKFCEEGVPEDVEQNLVLGSKNYHQFGKRLVDYVMKNKIFPKADIVPIIHRNDQYVVFPHSFVVEGYMKYCAVYCFNGVRYLLSLITQRSRDQIFDDVAGIISQDIDPEKKIKSISSRYKPRFLRLRKYEEKKLVEDLEVVS